MAEVVFSAMPLYGGPEWLGHLAVGSLRYVAVMFAVVVGWFNV